MASNTVKQYNMAHPPKPVYEAPVENHTQPTERDRKIRNQQLKVTWQNKCKKIDEIGILCGDKPWKIANRKPHLCSIYVLGQKAVKFSKANIHISS